MSAKLKTNNLALISVLDENIKLKRGIFFSPTLLCRKKNLAETMVKIDFDLLCDNNKLRSCYVMLGSRMPFLVVKNMY